ncbi:MAG: YceI family protein [Specibacter sp.]
MPRKWLIIGIALIVAIGAVLGGTALYAKLANDSAPDKLTLSTPTSGTATSGKVTPGTAGAGILAGAWTVSHGSQAGYRVKEVLNGQNVTVVGRTQGVTGNVVIDGTSLAAASISVSMTSVATDNSSRDSQFLGILKTSQFPTSTFTLTRAVDIGAVKDGVAPVQAVGELAVAGVKKSVTVSMKAQKTASGVEVSGSLPVTFSDYGIAAPNLGFVKVEDTGTIEMLLKLSR